MYGPNALCKLSMMIGNGLHTLRVIMTGGTFFSADLLLVNTAYLIG